MYELPAAGGTVQSREKVLVVAAVRAVMRTRLEEREQPIGIGPHLGVPRGERVLGERVQAKRLPVQVLVAHQHTLAAAVDFPVEAAVFASHMRSMRNL